MGTSITLEAAREQTTTDEQWELIKEHFINEYSNNKGFDENYEYLSSGTIYCPYSRAYIPEQIPVELREKLKGSNITIKLWYEEREPDEEKVL